MANISPYTPLKRSLSSVPAKALSFSSRFIVSKHLNIKQVLTSKNGQVRDYRGLAWLMKFEYNIKNFERNDDPTMKILETWEIRPNATLDKLIDYLEEMERHDVIEELVPTLERDAKTYLQSQNVQECPLRFSEITSYPMNNSEQRIVRDDSHTGEYTDYDAYVAYADEDRHFVKELANCLEQGKGFKLFIPGRDLLPGYAEHNTNMRLIEERCQKMLIILSPNFLRSPACNFQVDFAAHLAIEQRKRILIPVIIDSCEIPSMVRYITKIDFTKPLDLHVWELKKLISSLGSKDSSMFLNETFSDRNNASQNRGSVTSTNPIITYPTTMLHVLSSADNSTISASTSVHSEVSASNKDPNQSACAETKQQTSKKWKYPWSSALKKRFFNAYFNHSVSSSSNATSGFHSQTRYAIENYESSETADPIINTCT